MAEFDWNYWKKEPVQQATVAPQPNEVSSIDWNYWKQQPQQSTSSVAALDDTFDWDYWKKTPGTVAQPSAAWQQMQQTAHQKAGIPMGAAQAERPMASSQPQPTTQEDYYSPSKEQERSFWEQMGNSWSSGKKQWQVGQAGHDVMMSSNFEGLPLALSKHNSLQADIMAEPQAKNLFEKILSDTAASASSAAEAYKKAALPALGAGAVAGLIAGPAAIPTFKYALQAGSAYQWFKQGSGDIFLSAVAEGIDPKIARQVAIPAGVLYAASEFVFSVIPGLPAVLRANPIISSSIRRTAMSLGKEYAKGVLLESSEEFMQQLIQSYASNIAKDIQKTKGGAVLKGIPLEDMLTQAASAFVQSIGPSALLLAPGTTITTKNDIKVSQQMKAAGIPENQTLVETKRGYALQDENGKVVIQGKKIDDIIKAAMAKNTGGLPIAPLQDTDKNMRVLNPVERMEMQSDLDELKTELMTRPDWTPEDKAKLDNMELSERWDREVDIVQHIAEALGVKVVMVKGMPINGAVRSSKDTIFIDENSDQPALATMGHELSHYFESGKYETTAGMQTGDTVMRSALAAGVLQAKAAELGITEDQAWHEVRGDIIGQAMTTKDFWDRVRTQSPSLFQDMYSWIAKTITKLRKLFNKQYAEAGIHHDTAGLFKSVDSMNEAFRSASDSFYEWGRVVVAKRQGAPRQRGQTTALMRIAQQNKTQDQGLPFEITPERIAEPGMEAERKPLMLRQRQVVPPAPGAMVRDTEVRAAVEQHVNGIGDRTELVALAKELGVEAIPPSNTALKERIIDRWLTLEYEQRVSAPPTAKPTPTPEAARLEGEAPAGALEPTAAARARSVEEAVRPKPTERTGDEGEAAVKVAEPEGIPRVEAEARPEGQAREGAEVGASAAEVKPPQKAKREVVPRMAAQEPLKPQDREKADYMLGILRDSRERIRGGEAFSATPIMGDGPLGEPTGWISAGRVYPEGWNAKLTAQLELAMKNLDAGKPLTRSQASLLDQAIKEADKIAYERESIAIGDELGSRIIQGQKSPVQVNEAELDTGTLVYRNNEWHMTRQGKADGVAKELVDGETIRLGDFESVEAAVVVSRNDPNYARALAEYREQEAAKPAKTELPARKAAPGELFPEPPLTLVGDAATTPAGRATEARLAQERADVERKATLERQAQDLIPAAAKPEAPPDAYAIGQRVKMKDSPRTGVVVEIPTQTAEEVENGEIPLKVQFGKEVSTVFADIDVVPVKGTAPKLSVASSPAKLNAELDRLGMDATAFKTKKDKLAAIKRAKAKAAESAKPPSDTQLSRRVREMSEPIRPKELVTTIPPGITSSEFYSLVRMVASGQIRSATVKQRYGSKIHKAVIDIVKSEASEASILLGTAPIRGIRDVQKDVGSVGERVPTDRNLSERWQWHYTVHNNTQLSRRVRAYRATPEEVRTEWRKFEELDYQQYPRQRESEVAALADERFIKAGDTETTRKIISDRQQETGKPLTAAEKQKIIRDAGSEALLKEIAAGTITMDPVTSYMATEIFSSPAAMKRAVSGDPAARSMLQVAIGQNIAELRQAARVMRWARDPVDSPATRRQALIEFLLAPDDDTIGKWAGMSDTDKYAAARAESPALEERINSLKNLGVDLNALTDEELMDDLIFSSIVRELQAQRATKMDKVYEYWRNSILSGPLTFAANTIGNLTSGAWDTFVQKPMESLVGSIIRDENAPTGKSLRAGYKAILSALTQASANAVKAFATEKPIQRGMRIEDRGVAIAGIKGRGIRLPQRLLLATDEWFKTIFHAMAAAEYAERTANQRGYTRAERDAFMKYSMSNPESAAQLYAVEESLRLTWQNKPGDLGKAVIAARNSKGVTGWVFKFLFPFVTTPANIISVGIRKSPLGLLNMAGKKFITGAYGKPGGSQMFVRDAAEQVIAGAVTWTLYSMTQGDDDEPPRLTGSASSDPEERRFQWAHMPPQSIRIGDKWYSYSRIEPFATMITPIVDGINMWRKAKRGQGDTIPQDVWNSMKQLVRDKTFLQSLSDFISAIEDEDKAIRILQNFASSWMPNIVRQSLRATDPYIRDYRSQKEGWERTKDELNKLDSMILPYASRQPLPRFDWWGKPVTKKGVQPEMEGEPNSDLLWRLTVPIKEQQASTMNNIDRLIWNWNRTRTDRKDAWWPMPPRNSVKLPREEHTRKMPEAIYEKYQRRRGELAWNRLKDRTFNYDNPRSRDIDLIKEAFGKAGDIARKEVIREMMIGR